MEVVPLQLFSGQCIQVLELAHVLGEVTELAGLRAQSDRVRRAKLSLSEVAESLGVFTSAAAVPSRSSASKVNHKLSDDLAGKAFANAGASAVPSGRSVAGAGAMAVASLRSGNSSSADMEIASSCASVAHIAARDLVLQLRDVQASIKLLDQKVAAVRAEVREAANEASGAQVDTRASAAESLRLAGAEAKLVREQLATTNEFVIRVEKDAEALHTRMAADSAELRAIVQDLSAKMRTMEGRISSMDQDDRQHQLKISQEALRAVANVEERLMCRISDIRGELEPQHLHTADYCQGLARRAGEDRLALETLKSEVQDLRSRTNHDVSRRIGASPTSSGQRELPSAWKTALEDAVCRVQSLCEAADRKADEHQQQFKASAANFAAERASASERDARVAEQAHRRLVGEVRAQVRAELQRT